MTVQVPRALPLVVLSMLAACGGSTSGSAGSAPALAPKPAVMAAPKPFEYAASTGQYRLTAEGRNTQSMMGQSRETTGSDMRLMTIVTTRSAPDTVTMMLTIDSITSSNSMGMPTLGIEKVPGSKFTAKLSPNGTFYSATGPSEAENVAAAGMTDEVARALPRLKAILANGASWTDTVTDKVKQRGLDLAREMITKYTVAGDTTVAGEAGWKVARETAVKATGAGAVNGQSATLELTATSKGVLVVGKRGVLLGARGEESSNGTLVLPAMNNLQVSLVGNTTTLLTKVK